MAFSFDTARPSGGAGVYVTLSSLHGQFKGFIIRAEDAGTLEKKGEGGYRTYHYEWQFNGKKK